MESAGLTMAGQVMGTPEYMSPEQALGQKLDFRTDIYSLGIVVYELFAGRVPFRGDNPVLTVLKQIEEPPVLQGRVPNAVVPVLAKALAKDRVQRFSSAEEWRRPCGWLASTCPGWSPRPTTTRTPRPRPSFMSRGPLRCRGRSRRPRPRRSPTTRPGTSPPPPPPWPWPRSGSSPSSRTSK